MAEVWPQFAVVRRTAGGVTWLGSVTPYATEYKLEISYRPILPGLHFRAERFGPQVRVVSPALGTGGQAYGVVPHLYWVDGGHRLCVWDPKAREWGQDDLIAETTVYWSLRWLVRYEGWLATGRWQGKARDHGPTTRFHPDTGEALRWHDRWISTASELAFRSTVPNPVDRWWWDKGDLPRVGSGRFRTGPVRGPLRR